MTKNKTYNYNDRHKEITKYEINKNKTEKYKNIMN